MPLPAYFQDQHNREKLLTRYKTLQAISPELFEHGSGVASSLLAQLDGGNSHSSNPEPDYFSALDLPQRERKYSDATSLVVPGHRPASRLSVSTGAFPLDSNVSFYGFKTEDDDAASTADTLSEWGLEHLFETSSAGKSHARQRSTSTTHSLAHSLALYQPRSTTPLDPVPSDEPGDWEEDAPQVQAVNFEGRTNGQPRVRRASNASVLTTQTVNSSTGFSRPSTPQLPSRPGSALSRFDPGRTFGDHSVDLDYLARQQAVDARPRWYDQHHRPDVLIMPEPLATPQDWEREAEVEQNLDVEEQEEEPEQHAEVCSIPSLRSSGDSTRSSQKDSHQSVEQEKQQKEELEELAINKVPAGKLFGHSLMDELERRQAQNKSRARVYQGEDGRRRMTDAPPEGGGLAPPGSESRHIEDTEPWNRFSVVNFQDRLTQPQPRAQLPKSHSVFGVDKVMQSELAKLEKILKMEEAEKRMEAERERVQAADREEKEKQRAIRERKKAEKKKQWKKSHMLDDVILADVSSLTDKEDMDQIQHWSGKPNDTRPSYEEENDVEPTRVGGAAPSLTLAHLDLNNPGDGPSDIGAFLKRQDSTSSQNTEDDDNPWGLSQAPYGGKSNDFEYPKDAEVWRAQHKRKGSELPKFAFDDQSSSSDEEREADHDKWDEDSDDDDKPLNTLSRKPQERSVSQASKGHHEKTKSDVGTLLGIQSDLFGSKPVSRRSSSSSSGDDDSNEDLKELAATSEAPKRIRKPSSLGFGQVLSADADESSSDDDDRPLGQLPSSHSAKSAHSSSRQPSHNAPDDVPIGRLNPLLANHFAEEVPLGAQQPEFANAQNQENTALGQRFPGFAYKRSVQQQQEAAQAEALRLAEQQQNFHYAQMQQELMFQQAMLQQQQEQQQMQWAYMQALQNQTGVDGSMLGFSGPIAPEVASRNQKLVSRVDNWRADVE